MKCTVIVGRNGTGKTGVLLKNLDKNSDVIDTITLFKCF